MNLSAPFIARPVATTLLTIGLLLAGIFAYLKLPVAPLPQVDFPTISVQAQQPGASPNTMATSVAGPLERHLGSIADVTEMTSSSSVGMTRIVLQFGLDRDIDGAARDVQAAINAARADLPTSLRSNPAYHKINPADAPILILALTSKTLTQGQLYDAASNVVQQTLSQLPGVGEVDLGGSSLPAVRVELQPEALFKYGIGLEDVRAALASANANSPKGAIEDGARHYQLYTNDQASRAAQYRPLIIAYRNGAAVHLTDVAEVVDSVEDLRNAGLANGSPAVLTILYRQPGANIIDTVDRVRALLPRLKASLPGDVNITPVSDRSTTIRASLADTERTLVIAVGLVILVVFVFLRNVRATIIPSVAVPVSIIATFAAMFLLGYSLDNLSLMALTVATGFVVDDAIVVLENISRHMEAGMTRMQAALVGAREVGFTVLSISLSLIAVFIPILLMGGIVGRLFREFAVTLSLAILISLVISLTTTPMLCSRMLRHHTDRAPGRLFMASERAFEAMAAFYGRTLDWALRRPLLIIAVLFTTIALNVFLYIEVPKGFFPQQDTGRMVGGIQADQSISFQSMRQKLQQFMKIVEDDPAVDSVAGFTGGRQTNAGFMFVSLKPLGERRLSADRVITRLRRRLNEVAGARLFLQAVQDIRIGGRQSNAQYQFTLQGDSSQELYEWGPKLTAELQKLPELADVNSDQQQSGLETDVAIDRSTAARLNVTPALIDNTLYDAFGQRQVSTIYAALNQYHVVMEVAPRYWQSPGVLDTVYVSTSGGSASGSQASNAVAGTFATGASAAASSTSAASIASDAARNQASNSIANVGKSSASSGTAVSTAQEMMVPLSAFSEFSTGHTPLAVNHQGQFVASTISFNLPPNRPLSDAVTAINAAMQRIGVPSSIHGVFAGTAAAFQSSTSTMPILILAGLAAVYIVLGILYESYIHPITILSSLPSAGVGAVLGLMFFNLEFSIIALIGVILLIGIVKKNAIMMIDFALAAERGQGLSPLDSIRQACLLRFRPIMMTTFAAMLGALPLAFGSGEGAELRQPLGISIVSGLLASQVLTLYTTPVVYLYMERFRVWWRTALAPPRAAGCGAGGRRVRLWLIPSLLLAACTVGPDYQRPAAPLSAAFKEQQGWKPSAPGDAIDRGAWWSIYHDPDLDALEREVDISNQTLAASEAAYRQARALVREARAGLFPTATLTTDFSHSGGSGSGNSAGSSGASFGGSRDNYSLEGSASWDLDVWGKIRRSIESNVAGAEATAADIANARLSAQGQLAVDYFDLRAADELIYLLQDTVKQYTRSLQITQNQYNAGTAAKSDVITAQTQLLAAQAQLVNTGVARAQYEHAIAVLAGKAPSELSLPAARLASVVPVAPADVPSTLLERRPDIAAAERTMQEQNAQIGVAVAAYYPDISLSALGGYAGPMLGSLISASNALWSAGASAAETVFDGGLRGGQVAAARAVYDESVANYRQTVLVAFQSVEDQLAALRILEQEAAVEERTVRSAQQALQIALNEYQAGTVVYTTVITAQTTLLSAQESALAIQQNRLVASATLIEDLGGGWDTTQMPDPHELRTQGPIFP